MILRALLSPLCFYVLGTCIFGAFGGPLASTRCVEKCPPHAGKFYYDVGSTYIYSYEASNELKAKAAPDLSVKLKATATITVVSKCELLLKLSDVTIHHGPESVNSKLVAALEKNVLPFEWFDGRVDHVCPSPEDSDEITNIKKSIVSVFQNTMRSFKYDSFNSDTDILGTCDTVYKAKELELDSYEIKRTKNIKTCSNYIKGKTLMLTSFYPSSANRQHLPLLSSEVSECNEIVKSGILKEAICSESASFNPLSDYGYVVEIKGSSKLKFLSKSEEIIYKSEEVIPLNKESLVLKHFEEHHEKADNAEARARHILREGFCDYSIKQTQSEFFKMHDLVYLIRSLNSDGVERIYSAIENKELCASSTRLKSVYLDALKLASSGGALSLLVKLYLNNEMPFIDNVLWTTLMPFTPYVEEDSIQALLPLMRNAKNRQALLGATALAFKFCSGKTNCGSIRAVKEMSSVLNSNLGHKCYLEGKEDEVLTTLKALGNLGYFGSVSKSLLECAKSPANKMTTRLAAIDAFRRSPCNDEDVIELLEMYTNKAEVDELRIAALLSVSRCVTRGVAEKIAESYNHETSRQVELFTYSFIENLKSTSDPSTKSKVKAYFSGLAFKEPSEKTDFLKYSRSFESSFFSEIFNMGHVLSANVIHSMDAFLPRSGNIALKLNAFGNQIEMLEIGSRTEGMEHILEKVFGPAGIFSGIELKDIYEFIENQVGRRFKRSSDGGGAYENKIDALTERIAYNKRRDLEGNAFVRVMGHELAMIHFDKNLLKQALAVKVKELFPNVAVLRDIDVSKNLLFLDIAAVFPSLTGHAYKLDLNGSLSVGLRADGLLDLKHGVVDIDGKFKANVLGEVSAGFSIFTEEFQPGVRAETVFKAEMDYNAKAEVTDGRIAHLRIRRSMKGKVPLITLRRTLYVMNHEGKKELPKPPSYDLNYCTKYLSLVTGIKYCGHLSFPHFYEINENSKSHLRLPFDRAFEASLTAETIDSNMDGYELYLEIPEFMRETGGHKRFKFLFDTPNSRQDRKLLLEIDFTHLVERSGSLNVNLESPFYSLDFKGNMSNSNDQVLMNAEVIGNKKRRYSIGIDAKKNVKGALLVKYEPKIRVNLHSMEEMEFQGEIIYSNGRRKTITINLESPSFRSPFTIKGLLSKEGEKVDFKSDWKALYEFNINAFDQTHKLKGGFGRTEDGCFVNLGHHYEPDGRSYESVTFDAKVENINIFDRLSFSIDSKLLLAENEDLSSELKFDFSLKPFHHFKSDLFLGYGKEKVEFLIVSEMHGDFDSFSKMRISNEFGITVSCLDLDRLAKLTTVWDFGDKPKLLLQAGYKSERNDFRLDFKYEHLESKPLKLTTGLLLTLNSYTFRYSDEANEIAPGEYSWKALIEPTKGKEISTDYIYRVKYPDDSKRKILHEVEGTTNFPGFTMTERGSFEYSPGEFVHFSTHSHFGHFGKNITIDLKYHIGKTDLKFDMPNMFGNLMLDARDRFYVLTADVKSRAGQHLLLNGKATPGDPYILELEMKLDADRNPDRILKINLSSKKEGAAYIIAGSVSYANSISVDLSGKISSSFVTGPHSFQAALSGQDAAEPMALKIEHEIKDGHLTFITKYLRSGVEKIKLETRAKYIRHGFSHLDVELGSYLSSPYKSFDGKAILFKLYGEATGEKRTFLVEYRMKFSSSLGYEGKLDYTRNSGFPGDIKSTIEVLIHNRPIYLGSLNVEYRTGKYSIDAIITPFSKKKSQFLATLEHSSRFVIFHHSFNSTQMKYLQNVVLHTLVDFRSLEDTKVESNFDVNMQQIYSVKSFLKFRSLLDFDGEAEFLTKYSPMLKIISKSQPSGQTIKVNFALDFSSRNIISGSGELKKRKRGFNGDVTFTHTFINDGEKKLLVLSLHQDGKGKHERNYMVKFDFPGYEFFTISMKMIKDKDLPHTMYESKICRKEEFCFEIDVDHKKKDNGNEYIITYKRGGLEFSIERIRETQGELERFHTVIFNGDTRYGYDALFNYKKGNLVTGLGIILPSREIVMKTDVQFSIPRPRLKAELNLDGRNHPDRKLKADLRIENHLLDNNPSKIELSIDHEIFEKPIELEIILDYQGELTRVLSGKVSLDYSKDPDDKLIGTFDVESYPGKREILLKVYHKDHNGDDTNLDFTVKVNRILNDEEFYFGVLYEWREGSEDKEAHIIAKYPFKERKFSFDYERPKLSYKLKGAFIPSNSIFNDTEEIQLESTYNGRKTKGFLLIDWRDSCAKLYLSEDGGNTEREFSRITELCLNSGRKIASLVSESFNEEEKIYSPDLKYEIFQRDFNTIGIKYQADTEFVGKYLFMLTSLADELEANGFGKLPFYESPAYKRITQSLKSKVYDPVVQFIVPEVKQLFNDLNKDMLTLKEVVFNYFERHVDLSKVVDSLKSAAFGLFAYIDEHFRVTLYLKKLENSIKEYAAEMCNELEGCKSLVARFKEEGLRGLLENLGTYVLTLPSLIEKFLESGEIERHAEKAVNWLKVKLEPMKDCKCGEVIIRAVSLGFDKLETIVKERHLMDRIRNLYKRIKYRIESNEYVIRYREVSREKLFKVLETVFERGLRDLKQFIEECLIHFSPPSINKQYQINSLLAEQIDIDIHSNIVARILRQGANIAINVGRRVVKFVRSSSLNSAIATVKRVLDFNIVPQTAHAMIVHNKHFITFDEMFYDFSGECVYLLARDFEDKNFTLALKPKEDNNPPSIVMIKDKTSVELSTGVDGEVKVDDKSVDLPYISKHLTVLRKSHTITLKSKEGILVECHLVHEICLISMSGYYFGKTAGLLGTYNFEVSDDFQRPKGSIANSVNVFAKSYELKKGCKTSNLVPNIEVKNNSVYYKECRELFESRSSPMAGCYSIVKPNTFFRLCVSMSEMARESDSLLKKSYCSIAAAYSFHCEKNYVNVPMPSKCMKCITPNNTELDHGDRKNLKMSSTRSSDVVFLIEDHECNKPILGDLGALARSIEKEILNDGFRNNLFGVVAFSGDVGNPKIFTSKGKVLMPSRDLNGVAARILLENKKPTSDSVVFNAMKLAIKELYRSDTVKSLILLSCSPCKFDFSSLHYPVLQQTLLERNIVLHVIQDGEIRSRKGKPFKGDTEIIGVDPETVFHARDVAQSELVGDRSLRSHIHLPKDVCVALSQDVDGSFFSTHALKSSPREAKNWRNVFSRKISKSSRNTLSHFASCQTCDCTATNRVPSTVCWPCEQKKPRLPFSVGPYTRTVDAFIMYLLHVLGE